MIEPIVIISETSEITIETTSTPITLPQAPLTDDNVLESFVKSLFGDSFSEQNGSYKEDDVYMAAASIRQYQDKQPLSTNVLSYWYEKRFSNRLLSKLATVVHAVPATQVSVERCFSILRFIFNDYRTRLNTDLLADIMLVRLNVEFEH